MTKTPVKVKIEPIEDDAHPSKVCGIVMPIADFAPYPAGHWADVLDIIEEAVKAAGFVPKLVSSEDAVGIIQQRIVQNLYENEIVVVDVSGRNPNVMFELGMRLAFDKAAVIIKDELTPYTFDTSTIEHLGYRSDLHYQSINEFKANLASKIKSTHQTSIADASHSTFLKHFGKFTPATLEKRDGSELGLVLDELTSIRRELRTRGVQERSSGNVLMALPPGLGMNEFMQFLPVELRNSVRAVVATEDNKGRKAARLELVPGADAAQIALAIIAVMPDARYLGN
jgi:hypothetical protein